VFRHLRPAAARRRRIAIIGSVAVTIIAVLMGAALLRSPAWYDPPRIAVEDRQAVRNNLVSAQQAFTDSLMTQRGPFVYHLYQDDVNNWLAMRREIFPQVDELAPPGFSDPFVVFEQGRIILSARYAPDGVGAVLSLDLDAAYADAAILIRAVRLRCGLLRLPLALMGDLLTAPVDREDDGTWPGSPRIRGDLLHGLHIGAEALWKNGGVRYRVLGLTVTQGRIDLSVMPMGRQPATNLSDQD